MPVEGRAAAERVATKREQTTGARAQQAPGVPGASAFAFAVGASGVRAAAGAGDAEARTAYFLGRAGPDHAALEREADGVSAGLLGAPSLRVRPVAADGASDVASAWPLRTSALAGEPLGADLRRELEPRFGADLGAVRLHTGADAAADARALGARAFARGSDVAFASGEYAPSTAAGRRLIAHELAHVVQQSDLDSARAVVQRQTKPDAALDPAQLPRSELLEIALDRLAQPELKGYGGIEILRRQIEKDLQTPAGPDEELQRRHAERLLRTLHVVEPVFKPLAELAKKENYLEDLQPTMVAHIEEIQGSYAAAIFVSYSDVDPDEKTLANAEALMTGLPDYIVQQYLGPKGIEKLISELWTLRHQIWMLRDESGNKTRPLDKILGIEGDEPPASAEALSKDLEAARAEHAANPAKAGEAVRELTAKAQLMVGAMSALALYEQFSYWRNDLDGSVTDKFLSGRPADTAYHYETEVFLPIVEMFELAGTMTIPEHAQDMNDMALEDLGRVVNTKEFRDAVEMIKDREETIQEIDVFATIILITAAAALTAGAAGALVGGLIEVAGGGTLAVGAGTLVAESLAFTVVSRTGQTLAFGQAEGSFVGDFATNLLMFGALKGAGAVFESAFKLAPEAGAVAKGAYALGKAGTSLIVLQAFVEGEHAIKTGRFMTGQERERSIFQNVVMMVALSAGRFITEPIESRITAGIGAKLRPLFDARLKGLDADRTALKAQLEGLQRAKEPDPEAIKDVLTKIQGLWEKELKLLSDGVRRKAIQAEELKPALDRYNGQIAELELQLARLNVSVKFGTGPQTFRALLPGVVSFGPGGEAALRSYYAEQKGEFRESTRIKGAYEGRLRGELTYYVPEGQAFKGAPEAARVAGARDRALREAAADPEAQLGLDNLGKMFGALKGDEVLAAAKPEDMAAFLRALADPANVDFKRPDFYQELARRRAAIEFAQSYGAKALRNLALQYGFDDALVNDVLPRATAKIESAATPADRTAVLDTLRTETNRVKLDALLGKARPPRAPRPVRPTKANMGVDRGLKSWERFYESEKRYAETHGEPDVEPDMLKRRADVLQILDRAKQGVFADLSHSSKVDLVDRFDELATEAGIDRGRANALRGSLSEVLLRPDPNAPKPWFLNGVEVPRGTADATIPDYSMQHDAFTERVEQKSDWIDRGLKNKAGVYSNGTAAAHKYLADAKADLKNLPPGDRISIDFIRDPGEPTRKEMLRILLGDGTILRVRFGTTWYPPGAVP